MINQLTAHFLLTFMRDWRKTEADGCGTYMELLHPTEDPPVFHVRSRTIKPSFVNTKSTALHSSLTCWFDSLGPSLPSGGGLHGWPLICITNILVKAKGSAIEWIVLLLPPVWVRSTSCQVWRPNCQHIAMCGHVQCMYDEVENYTHVHCHAADL